MPALCLPRVSVSPAGGKKETIFLKLGLSLASITDYSIVSLRQKGV